MASADLTSPAPEAGRPPRPGRPALPPPGRLRHALDALFRELCRLAAVLVLVLAALLLAVLVWQAWPAMRTLGMSFLWGKTWDPNKSIFGARAFVWGTVATSAIAMAIAVPLGVGTAAFLSEIAPRWLRRAGAFFVEMLAVVPSVVYGFWGLFVLAPLMQRVFTALGGPNQGGVGILSAGLILAIMIVPYVASVSYDVIRSVPRSQREGALALGATRWQTTWSVVLPYARPGILGGCFLALGRALGETMAVTMLIGNTTTVDLSPFATGNSIASVIANEFTEAPGDLYRSALVELGLLLMLVTVVINALARVLIWKVSRPGRRSRPAPAPDAAPAAVPPPAPTSDGIRTAITTAPVEATPAARFRLTAGKRSARLVDRLMTGVLGLCLAVTVGSLFFILGYLVVHGVQALDWNFFTRLPVAVGEKGGGLANALLGSVLMVGLATLLAVPLGLGAAVYLAEYRSDRLGPVVRFVGELLGGVPSIVIGIFAYNLVVRPLGHPSGWAGAFALAVMMVPVVMRASEEALRLVPASLRQASYALAANRAQTVVRVVVPAAMPAVITAVFLSIARVAGETAPLLLTAGGNQYWPRGPGDQMPSLPVFIFTYAMSAYDDWRRQAWAAALVLLAVVMLLNFGVRLATGRRGHQLGRAD
jgi:phosphate transport system permease protein